MSILDKAWEETAQAVSVQFDEEYFHDENVVVSRLTDNRLQLWLPTELSVPFLLNICEQYGLDAHIDLSRPDVIVLELSLDTSTDTPSRVEILTTQARTHKEPEVTALMELLDLSSRSDARTLLSVGKLCSFTFTRDNVQFMPYNPVGERVLHYTGMKQLSLVNFRYLYYNWTVNTAVIYPGVVAIAILPESSNTMSTYGQRQERIRQKSDPHHINRKRNGDALAASAIKRRRGSPDPS